MHNVASVEVLQSGKNVGGKREQLIRVDSSAREIIRDFPNRPIVHVLHHCDDGIKVLEEAKRVAKRVIVIEDTFRSKFEWLVISIGDAVTNFEFKWHKFRKSNEWKKIIKKHNWKLIAFENWFEILISSLYSYYCLFVIE